MPSALACGDVMAGCAATFSAATDAEVVEQHARHAAEVHGIPELDQNVRANVAAAIRRS